MEMKWMTYVAVALGMIVVAIADNAPGSICLSTCEGTRDGFYRDCGDCNWFLSCSDGVLLREQCPPGTAWNDVRKSCDQTHLESCRYGGRDVAQFSVNSSETPVEDNSRREPYTFPTYHSDLRKLLAKWMNEIGSSSQSQPAGETVATYNPEKELKKLSQNHKKNESRDGPRLVLHTNISHSTEKTAISERRTQPEDLFHGNSAVASPNHSGDSTDVGAHVVGEFESNAAMNPTVLDVHRAVDLPANAIKMTANIHQYLKAVNQNSADQHKRESQTASPKISHNVLSRDCFFRSGVLTTFDNHDLAVSGNCRYVAARVCSSSDLFVEVKMSVEEGKQNRTLVEYVDVVMGRRWARLHSVGVAFADGIVIPPGRAKTNDRFSVKTEAEFSQLETDDGIVVTVDRENRFFLFLPESYSRKVCGLCGNMNGNSSDDAVVPSIVFEYNVRPVPEQSTSCAAQFAPKKE